MEAKEGGGVEKKTKQFHWTRDVFVALINSYITHSIRPVRSPNLYFNRDSTLLFWKFQYLLHLVVQMYAFTFKVNVSVRAACVRACVHKYVYKQIHFHLKHLWISCCFLYHIRWVFYCVKFHIQDEGRQLKASECENDEKPKIVMKLQMQFNN